MKYEIRNTKYEIRKFKAYQGKLYSSNHILTLIFTILIVQEFYRREAEIRKITQRPSA